MNQVGSDTAQWHLEQAAILEQIAAREERHSFFRDAERHHDKAQKHRDQAAIIERERRTSP